MFTDSELRFSVKYPFSDQSKEVVKYLNFDLHNINTDVLERSKQRAIQAVENGIFEPEFKSSSKTMLIVELLSYPVAKILVALTKDRFLYSKYAEAEARGFLKQISVEEPKVVKELAAGLNFVIDEDSTMSLPAYVKAIPSGSKYSLINAKLRDGRVKVEESALRELLPESFKNSLIEQLSMQIETPEIFQTYSSEVFSEANRKKAMSAFQNMDYGEVDLDSFPPCMKSIITELNSGIKTAHTPRFVLATFAVNAGLPVEQIVEFYSTAPNFDENKTTYFIEYNMGKRGSQVKYSAPACDKMVSYGLCVNKDALCNTIKHPLAYYKRSKGVNKDGKK